MQPAPWAAAYRVSHHQLHHAWHYLVHVKPHIQGKAALELTRSHIIHKVSCFCTRQIESYLYAAEKILYLLTTSTGAAIFLSLSDLIRHWIHEVFIASEIKAQISVPYYSRTDSRLVVLKPTSSLICREVSHMYRAAWRN